MEGMPPPPPPQGSTSPPGGRFVRRHHQELDGGSPGLDTTQRPPPPSGTPPSRPNPRGGSNGQTVSPNHPGHAVSMQADEDEDLSPQAVPRKLRAIRRIASFNKLTSVPERIQQWFDGLYSTRYASTSALPTASEADTSETSHQQLAINASIRAASLRLHSSLATFALSHCFDADLFDVPEGNLAAQIQSLSTLGSGGGSGVDHATNALFEKWCETFETNLEEFVQSVLRISEAELGATLDLDKREEEGTGEGVSLFAGAGNTPIHDLRAAIAPLSYILDKRTKASPSTTPRNHALSRPTSAGMNQSPSPLSIGDVSASNPALGSSSLAATPTASGLSFGEKEHFYRWSDCIEFASFVAAMRGTRTAIAKLIGDSSSSASSLAVPEIATLFRNAAHEATSGNTGVIAHERPMQDSTERLGAQKAVRSVAQKLSLTHNSDESNATAALAFYVLTPLISFIRDRSVAARQAFRRKSALLPLMSVWCPMNIDEDIWPVIQSLMSAAGVALPPTLGSSGLGIGGQPFRVVLGKQQQKELTLFRIRLSAASKKAESAALHANGGVSASLLSSPHYLLKPTAAAVGAIATAVELTDAQTATSQSSSVVTKASAAAPLDASEDPEKDWMRFLSVFAEGLDSATFDGFLSYMFSVVLPGVVTKDCAEIVRIAKVLPPGSPGSPGSSASSFADAFLSSVSSSSPHLAAKKSDPSTVAAVHGAARTVKRVFWVAFQQLDQFRKDRIPLAALLELLAGTAEEIKALHESSNKVSSSALPHSKTVPQDLLLSLAELSRTALEKLSSYVRFNTKDKSKLIIRLKNEKIATARDAALLQMYEDVTRGSQKTDASKEDAQVADGSAAESTITLTQFVHIVKDLVFDPQYLAAHPTSSVAASPSSPAVCGAAAPGRHLYWSELAAFVEVIMATSNQAKYKQLFRK